MSTKKRLSPLLVLLLPVIFLGSCSLSKQSADEAGNSNANIVNAGTSVRVEDTIYFNNIAEDQLFAIKTDGSEERMISTDAPRSLNFYKGWLYYASAGDSNKIVKIKTDGSERTEVGDRLAMNMILQDDKIYFIDLIDAETANAASKLSRMNLDGSGLEQLVEENVTMFNLLANSIIYVDAKENLIYHTKLDGSEAKKLSDTQVTFVNTQGEYIYYTDIKNSGSSIYRMKLDGTETTQLSDDPAVSINVSGDWIYYTSVTESGQVLKRMKTDGSAPELINENSAMLINVHEDWLVYVSIEFSGLADFKVIETIMKTDGSGRKDYEAKAAQPTNDIERFPMGKEVSAESLTITVLSAWTCNILESEEPGMESQIFDSVTDGTYLFLNLTVRNDGKERMDLYHRIGLLEDIDATAAAVFYAGMADISDDDKRQEPGFHAKMEDYKENFMLEAGQTKTIQLFLDLSIALEKSYVVLLKPDEFSPAAAIAYSVHQTKFVTTAEGAYTILQQQFPSEEIQMIQGVGYQMAGEDQEMMYYLFELKKSNSLGSEYYLIKRDTGEIYKGAFDEKFPDYPAVPSELFEPEA